MDYMRLRTRCSCILTATWISNAQVRSVRAGKSARSRRRRRTLRAAGGPTNGLVYRVSSNVSMASYFSASTVQRRIPQQERGERRVAKLLEAAEAVIAQLGYDAATMRAIAGRAGAAIGSLYQFFPNKACITQALRAAYARQFDDMCAPLASQASSLSPEALAGRLVDLTVQFAETHPALPALLEAPHSTRTSPEMQNILRERFAGLLLAQNPCLSRQEALRLGTATLHIIKTLSQLYTELPRGERRRMVQEFKIVLFCYFNARLGSRSDGRIRN